MKISKHIQSPHNVVVRSYTSLIPSIFCKFLIAALLEALATSRVMASDKDIMTLVQRKQIYMCSLCIDNGLWSDEEEGII